MDLQASKGLLVAVLPLALPLLVPRTCSIWGHRAAYSDLGTKLCLASDEQASSPAPLPDASWKLMLNVASANVSETSLQQKHTLEWLLVQSLCQPSAT